MHHLLRAGFVAAALPAMLSPSWVRAQDDAAAGQRIAESHCSRCHVIGDYNPTGGIGSTPSFQLLVNGLDDWQERFSTFHARRPHPAVVRIAGFAYPDPNFHPPNAAPIEMELEDVEKLVAFARTLQDDSTREALAEEVIMPAENFDQAR